MEEIQNLWCGFKNTPFPQLDMSEEESVGLAELDTFVAGCIETFIHNKGKLDTQQESILKRCAQELESMKNMTHDERG